MTYLDRDKPVKRPWSENTVRFLAILIFAAVLCLIFEVSSCAQFIEGPGQPS